MRRPELALLVLTGLFAGRAALPAENHSLTETEKIQALLKHVASLQDARFVRNGKEYDAGTAARFLRGKWEAHRDEVKTARDFIEKVASASSTSGKPYLIRFKDGREVRSRQYLGERLKELEKPGASRRWPQSSQGRPHSVRTGLGVLHGRVWDVPKPRCSICSI